MTKHKPYVTDALINFPIGQTPYNQFVALIALGKALDRQRAELLVAALDFDMTPLKPKSDGTYDLDEMQDVLDKARIHVQSRIRPEGKLSEQYHHGKQAARVMEEMREANRKLKEMEEVRRKELLNKSIIADMDQREARVLPEDPNANNTTLLIKALIDIHGTLHVAFSQFSDLLNELRQSNE